ncbi:MAG: DUF1963 domain-containing protein [Phenylobacterium sp.]
MAGVLSFFSKLFARQPKEIPPPTERVQAILDRIHAEARPCLHLVPGGARQTRFGGAPEITGDWPRFGGHPMAHLARMDLAAIRAAGGPDWLPAGGRLHVFLDMGIRAQDFEPEQPGACIVRWETGDAPPLSPPADLKPRSRIAPFPLTFQSRISHADERVDIDWKRLTRDEERTLDAAILGFLSPEPAHQIGGYPGNLQGDVMEIQCAVASARGDDIRNLGDEDPTPADFAAARDWRLLLQVDSDPAAGFDWIQTGRLYFWVHEAEARAGDFSRVFVLAQFL